MKKYDPTLVDEYIAHITELSRKRRCYAKKDIYNSFGVLLIKKGTLITQQSSAALDNHNLNAPVDEAIELENALNEHSLLEAFLDYFDHNPYLFNVHEKNNFEKALEHLCLQQAAHHVMLQKLTVLKERLPEEYKETLFSAWFAALLSKNAGLESAVITAAFTAGLYSNLGLLHIPQEAIDSKDSNPVAYQTHSLLSSLIARATKMHDKETLLAIMEHHEALYGEGYPHSKNIATMCQAGLSLSVASYVYHMAICLPEVQQLNLNIALPYMRIHYALNAKPIFTSALKTIALSQLPALWENLSLNQSQYQEYLLSRTLLVCELSASINLLNNVLSKQANTKENIGILTRLQRTVALLHSTGMNNTDIIEILCADGDDQISFNEMIEYDLMQANFFSAIQFLYKQLIRFVSNNSLEQTTERICKEQITAIGKLLKEIPAETFFHLIKQKLSNESNPS